ncbi:MAG TPA: polysaccharide export protein EpsE [Albitalea sp.]|nr:polysaccharide export protein EpsE [Albitalea sp.]
MRKLIHCWLLALTLCASAFAQGADVKAAEHVLGAADVIRVTVFQNPELSVETRISEQGVISYPLLGNVALAGLSVSQGEQKIAKALRDGGFVLKPQVSILLLQIRSALVSVLGQVAKPGRYPIESTNSKVSEIIASAGGVVPGGADVVSLSGTRNGKPIKFEVDLPAILQAGKTELDMVVANGDILFVDRAPFLYVHGEVQRPGMTRLERGMTVMQALAASGGLTQRGTERGLRINRRDPNGNVRVIEPKMNDFVERDDVIYVRESMF